MGGDAVEQTPCFVYLLRCADGSLYTGFTTDWRRRFREHSGLQRRGAKYTRSHEPLRLERVWQAENKADALRLEYHIKHALSHAQKEQLIAAPELLEPLLGHRLDCRGYHIVSEE